MGGTLDYSTTAGSNTTVGGVSIAEGMTPGGVNNAMRAMMADSRKWQLDWSGVTTAGSANAYTMTCNQGIAAYADGQRFSFRADRNNTGAATLNIDARGAKALRKVSGGALAALVADDLVEKAIYDVVFNVVDDVFVIVGFSLPAISTFALGLLNDADEAAAQATLGLEIGVDVQAADPFLDDIAALPDPGGNRVLGWDDTANELAWFDAGAGVSLAGNEVTSTGGVFAWANYSSTTASGTYSRTGTLVTCTLTTHGMTTGQFVRLDFTTGSATDGYYQITVVDANTFTVVDAASGATSGNVTRLVWVRASSGISEVSRTSTGITTCTFSSAQPDAFYAVNLSTDGGTIFLSFSTLTTADAVLTTRNNSGTLTDVTSLHVIFVR
jgi:hypothetical protein